MAMVPIIELRGGSRVWCWGEMQDTQSGNGIIAVLGGNLLPVPFLVVLQRNVFAWMHKKSDKLNSIVLRMGN